MQNFTRLALILCAAALFPSAPRADNPIVQTIYTADPAPIVHNGRVYVYTGHDEDGSTWFTMREWRVYSSADMVNWTDHGSPLSLSTFSWARQDAWAGQCIQRNGRFYWYVPIVASNGSQSIGVAVSDSPTGPFTDPLGRPLISGAEIDPTVFIDDNGQAYLYYGNPNLWYVRLNSDMISYSGSPTRVNLTTQGFGTRSGTDRPTSYEEAPWLFKRGSLYYMMFAGGPVPEHIAYSTGSSATGPWTYRGVIMPTQGGSFTNHAGIVDFAGNSYFFYHNGALPGGGGFTRSVAVERFTYNADGTIPRLNMTTGGPPAVANLNPFNTVEAETIAWEVGVETERCNEGGMNVSNISNGDYIKVKSVDFGTGATSFQARVASATSGGNIQIRLGSTSGTLVGTCAVPGTGGWQTWTTVNCNVSGATGVRDVFFVFTGGSGNLFNFNWWKFVGGSTTTYALDVTKNGTGAGTVAGGPINCGSTCSANVASGTAVTLTATPAAGSTFGGWSGACTGSGNCVVTMTAARSVTATFNGSVVTLPISINVGGAASGTFVADAYFSGGSTYSVTTAVDTSQLSGTIPPQSVLQTERYGEFTYTIPGLTAGNAYAVTLYFDEVYWTAAGQRTFNVAINGATVLSAFDIFAAAGGTARAISRTFNTTANASGQVVVQFSRAGGPDNPKVCGITVASAGPTTQYALTVTKEGTGGGTVTGGGINCGATCSASYDSGTAVTLTASPASGSTFSGWSGACTGTGTCTVTMTAARTVTATFTGPVNDIALTVTKAGTGSGTVTASGGGINCGSVCSAVYASGTVVTLTATAASGSTFGGWSGACTGTGTCTVTMTAARTVTATFNQTGATFTNARIVSAPSSRCLDVTGASTANGTQAQIYDCHGQANQSWTYDSSQNLVVYGNKCLQASGGGTSAGTAVVIGDCTGQAYQRWNVNSSNGTITNVQSGLCMDVNGAGTANGTKVIIWTCHGGTNQRWTPQ